MDCFACFLTPCKRSFLDICLNYIAFSSQNINHILKGQSAFKEWACLICRIPFLSNFSWMFSQNNYYQLGKTNCLFHSFIAKCRDPLEKTRTSEEQRDLHYIQWKTKGEGHLQHLLENPLLLTSGKKIPPIAEQKPPDCKKW